MSTAILFGALLVIVCLLLTRVTNRFGVPTLLVFIGLGMLSGSDGLLGVAFDNYALAEQVCSLSLIFIMFYGGFGTNWQQARPVAAKSMLLSTLGVVLTALLVGVFCRLALGFGWLESFLIGSVIGSTDAASVFSILRSKHLNLRDGTASLLEVESGSNDPAAYMLTVIFITLLRGEAGGGAIALMIVSQLVFGAAVGVLTALLAAAVLRNTRVIGEDSSGMFVFAIALFSYGAASALGGNGYLSAYLTGLILGNRVLPGKKALVHFFDSLTGLMQILIFFLLGLLSFPSRLPRIALPALLIALFLTFAARPAAVFALLSPFRCPTRQKLLVSWAGLRGAASIVFAIMAMGAGVPIASDLFHIVFCIVLFSIALQGSLIPFVARWLGMIDDSSDVMKTFSDYTEESPVQFLRLQISDAHPWANRPLREVNMPSDMRLVLIHRGGEQIVPRGHTVLLPGDTAVVSGPSLEGADWGSLSELLIRADHPWCGRALREIAMELHCLVVMVRRGGTAIIPNGDTRLMDGDVLVVNWAAAPQPAPEPIEASD